MENIVQLTKEETHQNQVTLVVPSTGDATKLREFREKVKQICAAGSLRTILGTWRETLITFFTAWVNWIFPSMLTGEETRTASVQLSHMLGLDVPDYGGMMSASLLFCLPTIVLYAALQKYVVAGFKTA